MRNSKPPSESAFCVESVVPPGEMSDACAPDARPVTYTWSTLPTAVKAVDAEAPGLAVELMTSHVLSVTAPARAIRPSGEIVLRPTPFNTPCLLTVGVDTPLWTVTGQLPAPGNSGTARRPAALGV